MPIQKKNGIPVIITIAPRSCKYSGQAFASFVVSPSERGQIVDWITTKIEAYITWPNLRLKHPVHIFLPRKQSPIVKSSL